MANNKFTGIRVEFHIIQSFPVSCLNRDDLGSPKSAVIGGVPRARVSSQCWKRAVRMQMHELGVRIANRTKFVGDMIANACLELGANPEQAVACGKDFVGFLEDKSDNDANKTSAVFFISDSEAKGVAAEYQKTGFAKISPKDLKKIAKASLNPAHDGLDIALFGRMVANAADMNVEAAASFAHAISTHKVNSEVDFFTAVDDCNPENTTGSAHMGSLEFNSATYYRYVSLDFGQLAETLKTDEIQEAVSAFTQALFLAVPSARQATMSAATPWNYAIITIRKGQRMQLPFNSPVSVSAKDPDIVKNSIEDLKIRFGKAERMYGKLFGLKKKMEISAEDGSIDDVIAGIESVIESL